MGHCRTFQAAANCRQAGLRRNELADAVAVEHNRERDYDECRERDGQQDRE